MHQAEPKAQVARLNLGLIAKHFFEHDDIVIKTMKNWELWTNILSIMCGCLVVSIDTPY